MRVYLMTSDRLRDADWPREGVDDILCMPGDQSDWNLGHMLVSIAGLCRHLHLDPVVALDELFGLKGGASHTEFIRSHETDEFLFLVTSARVGGAQVAEFIEAGTGVSLWTEWAKLENLISTGSSYSAPEVRNEYAGLLVSLARQESPETSVFPDPEVVWNLAKRHHAGLVVRSPDDRRVAELIDSYTDIVRKDFHATAPPREKVGY